MNLLAFAFACKPSGEAYTLEVDIQLPPNQLDLFDDIDSVDLLVETDAGTETYELSSSGAGARSEFIGTDPLEEATIAIAGYDGGELIAFGRSELIDHSSGEGDVSILVARVDDFAWVDMPQETAFSALAASGDGSFILFGGAEGQVATTSSDEMTPLDGVWSLPVAPPSADFSLTELTTMPPLDEEDFEYGSAGGPGRLGHTATRLRQGSGILLTGGSSMYEDQSHTSQSTWVFDPQSNTYTEGDPLSERRMLHTTAVGPTGQVFIIGGFGSAAPDVINPLETVEIFDPDSLTITPMSGNPRAGMIGSGAARYGNEGVLICGGMTIDISVQVAHSSECDLIGVEGALNDAEALEVGLIWPRMVAMDDDSVLLTGGYIGELYTYYSQGARLEATERVFLYRDGSWSEVASMNNPRAQHAAALLPDGRVLVAGGSVKTSNYFLFYNADALACAEIYDPQTDEWTEVDNCDDDDAESSLPVRMARPSYDVDPSYGVLIAGGYDEDGYALSSAAYFVGQPEL